MKKLIVILMFAICWQSFSEDINDDIDKLVKYDNVFKGTKEKIYRYRAERLLKKISIVSGESYGEIVDIAIKGSEMSEDNCGEHIKALDIMFEVYDDMKNARNPKQLFLRELVDYYTYYKKGYYKKGVS